MLLVNFVVFDKNKESLKSFLNLNDARQYAKEYNAYAIGVLRFNENGHVYASEIIEYL